MLMPRYIAAGRRKRNRPTASSTTAFVTAGCWRRPAVLASVSRHTACYSVTERFRPLPGRSGDEIFGFDEFHIAEAPRLRRSGLNDHRNRAFFPHPGAVRRRVTGRRTAHRRHERRPGPDRLGASGG